PISTGRERWPEILRSRQSCRARLRSTAVGGDRLQWTAEVWRRISFEVPSIWCFALEPVSCLIFDQIARHQPHRGSNDVSTFLAQARPIDRESLSRRVYRDLRDMLISGQLQPGERLTLDGVAKALGTSHMPVREAMRQLAAERVLEALPNRALRVPVMTRARFRELL